VAYDWAKIYIGLPKRPWLRRVVRQHGTAVAWVWVVCILEAKRLDRGGLLAYGEDPMDAADIADLAGVTEAEATRAIELLLGRGWLSRVTESHADSHGVSHGATVTGALLIVTGYEKRQEETREERQRRQAAERQQRRRDRRKAEGVTESHADSHGVSHGPVTAQSRGVTHQTETETETERREQKKPPAPPTRKKARVVKANSLELPQGIDPTEWAEFVKMRIKVRAPLTDHAQKLAVGKLQKLQAEGHNPNAVLRQSTMNSWKGLFGVKPEGNGNRPGSGPGGRETAGAAFARQGRERRERLERGELDTGGEFNPDDIAF
jgi:hypothetical protein